MSHISAKTQPIRLCDIEKMIGSIKQEEIPFLGYHIPVKESSLFPFEQTYEACDIKTRQIVLIPSGNYIHGMITEGKSFLSFQACNILRG